MFFKIMLSI